MRAPHAAIIANQPLKLSAINSQPEVSPTPPTSHPSLFGRAHILSLSSRLRLNSQRGFRAARLDWPGSLQVLQSCSPALAIVRSFFFHLCSLRSLSFVFQKSGSGN